MENEKMALEQALAQCEKDLDEERFHVAKCKKDLEEEKHHVAKLLEQLAERNTELDDCRKKMNELKELLVSKSCTYEDVDFYNAAIELVGLKEVVKCKIDLRLQLWEEDYAFLMDNLKEIWDITK